MWLILVLLDMFKSFLGPSWYFLIILLIKSANIIFPSLRSQVTLCSFWHTYYLTLGSLYPLIIFEVPLVPLSWDGVFLILTLTSDRLGHTILIQAFYDHDDSVCLSSNIPGHFTLISYWEFIFISFVWEKDSSPGKLSVKSVTFQRCGCIKIEIIPKL